KLETTLSSNVTNIGSALAKVQAAKAAANSTSSQRIQFLGNIAGALVSIASDLYASIQIHDAMEKAQLIFEQARSPLKDALVQVNNSTNRKLDRYEFLLSCKMTLISGYPADKGSNEPCQARYPQLREIINKNGNAIPANTLARYDDYVAVSQEDAAL